MVFRNWKLKNGRILFIVLICIAMNSIVFAQVDQTDWADGRPEGCTNITVGKKASADGSVITSHTCDSHRTQAWMDVMPPKVFPKGSMQIIRKRTNDDSLAMPAYKYVKTGEIPQAQKTFGYINTAYPCMNQHQLAVGESTFGGREELQSDKGLIDCQQLVQLMLERCKTAREAIQLAGQLLEKYGYNGAGECLTIADPQEVWHLEIVGPGKDKVGAIWAAQRVPDGHVSVNANASRIRQVNLKKPDEFMASKNLTDMAKKNGMVEFQIRSVSVFLRLRSPRPGIFGLPTT